ncbi:MAG: adenylate kinase [Gaiellaceae bacterium]
MAERTLLYGVTGSGKSVLAERIAAVTGIPWHSVDDLTWEPGWVQVPDDEQRRRFEEICAGERWILDTAYSRWRDVALARAELIVALDYPRWLSLGRLLARTVARVLDGRPVCNGNRETWRTALARDSIVAWHFRTFTRKRRLIRAWEADPPVPQFVRLTSPRETERWLATLVEPAAAA